MFISEEEKKQILSKYQDNTSDEFLRHLKRAYPVDSQKILDNIVHFITIDDKRKILTGNKKNMVNKIFNLEDGKWNDIDEPTLRRTIKKYIDGNLIN
jgi:hypothetical protein